MFLASNSLNEQKTACSVCKIRLKDHLKQALLQGQVWSTGESSIVLCIMRPSEKVHRNFSALKEKGKQLVCLSYGVESWWTAGLIYVIVGAWKVAAEAFLTNQKYFPSIRLLWNVNTSLLNFSSPLGWELDYALFKKKNVLWFDQKFVFMYSHRGKKTYGSAEWEESKFHHAYLWRSQ